MFMWLMIHSFWLLIAKKKESYFVVYPNNSSIYLIFSTAYVTFYSFTIEGTYTINLHRRYKSVGNKVVNK